MKRSPAFRNREPVQCLSSPIPYSRIGGTSLLHCRIAIRCHFLSSLNLGG